MSSSDPPFATISIVGLGLIGGSIALAVREQWPQVRIAGVDRKAVLAHALGSGAIDRMADSAADAAEADLIILAAPVRQNLKLLAEVAQRLPSAAVVTDVGSTKRDIVAEASALACASFVGGHPIGGAEQGGFGFARPDLFRNRPWIFTPAPSSPGTHVERLFAFAKGAGARPTTMDAVEHDRLMAFLSHLPQLTASALMQAVGRGTGADALRLAGRGLVDSTRLASSPAETWRDVCATNADALAPALDALIATLTELRQDLRTGQSIERIFTEAARWRAELLRERE